MTDELFALALELHGKIRDCEIEIRHLDEIINNLANCHRDNVRITINKDMYFFTNPTLMVEYLKNERVRLAEKLEHYQTDFYAL